MRGVIGGAIAGALVLLSAGESGAKRKKKCKKTQKKCGKKCIPKAACCGGCSDGTCCNGVCVDLATDADNCGVCGKSCPLACINGTCTCTGTGDCPTPDCQCSTLLQGGISVCRDTIGPQACATNAECGLGSACFAAGGGRCAPACDV